MREQQEELWIKHVFHDIHLNDCPSTSQVYVDEHDNNFSEYYKASTSPIDDNYKVINSMTVALHREHEKEPVPPWQFEESKWEQTDDLQWVPPDDKTHQPFNETNTTLQSINKLQQKLLPTEQHNNICLETDDGVIATTKSTSSSTSSTKMEIQQSDTGANTSATNNLSLLHDVVYIKPVNINSAAKDSSMQMLAVGRIDLFTTLGDKLYPLCYYSPQIDGTIISPTAIVYEFDNKFKGFSKICDCTKDKGYLSLDAHDQQDNMIIPLVSYNKLWYHDCTTINSHNLKPVINKLSQAASYKLWHQRLCHPGKSTMQKVHLHATGIPPLKGNSFWKCSSCMTAKCHKSYHTSRQAVKKNNSKSVTLKDLLAEEKEPIDDIYMPHALPGQHFHCDFGFMRSKSYAEKECPSS